MGGADPIRDHLIERRVGPSPPCARCFGHHIGVIVTEVKCRNLERLQRLNRRFENLIGVVPDPVKVTRSALQNAASIASMLLTTETLISDLPEKNPPAAAPPMPDY
ncbi:MAG TPA: hypothetical protein DEV93_15430 [Chloroflexi bacterium]|nr:hypothetical protein [Chloroflexota bacterium]